MKPETQTAKALDTLAINTIRLLAADAVQRADSGHPGMPMGAAPMAYVLWTRRLRHNPDHPGWPERDRFVLSAGHASMLLYALLHLSGYDLPLEELRRFRQWGSRTPGHPEHGLTPGVETTTGPLGQGFGNAVGMAIAEAHLAALFNRPEFEVVDHRTWVLASDGDLMEGVQAEAASLAGHLRLGKLNVLYDDNRVTIDGPTELAFSEDVGGRYRAYGWHTERVEDGNDIEAIDAALARAESRLDRPSLIIVRTRIGFGSPNKEGTASAHGEPLGQEELARTKERLGWPPERFFHVPEEVRERFGRVREAGRRRERAWRELFDRYRARHPELAAELERRWAGELPADWDAELPRFATQEGPIATRAASGRTLNAIARRVPELLGGSADLSPSNKTLIEDSTDFAPVDRTGRNLRFGVREHAMGAIANGLALHGGVRPYVGTFLIFSDYMRPAVRLAALMRQRVVYVYTHDSIALGEDGPTHQPVEQLASLRAIPGLTVVRPGDANETVGAWRVALVHDGPVALALTRQKIPVLAGTSAEGVARGAYVFAEGGAGSERLDLLLLASGSELHLALAARELLEQAGVFTRVVSFPSWELFDRQEREYRERVLPRRVRARLAVEAGATQGWCRWVGDGGAVVGIERFGASAPAAVNLEKFGFTVENVVRRAKALL